MSNTNRTSPIRRGFAYQDFWGLWICGEWLANPEKYKTIQFETAPDDNEPSKFYLDDIVCLDGDNLYHFYQIKHRQDTANKWAWDDLLKAEKKKGSSLIKKWSESLYSRINKTKQAVFITNAEGDDTIVKFLDGELLDLERIKKDDPQLYKKIVDQVGNNNRAEEFFKLFHFRFNQENLENGSLEEKVRQKFYLTLSATKPGVDALIIELWKECQKKITGPIDIHTIRTWCEFDQPRLLDEQFHIPEDFEFFDKSTNSSILADLKNPDGGVKILFGKPGTGKSVYLSKLDSDLKQGGTIAIKHHYHISPEDANPQERLNTARIIEALKAQLKTHSKQLGALANRNSGEIKIAEFIGTMAKNLHKAGTALVIIIDGLDHVLRYGEKSELESFLKEVCVPQPGVWLIMGMQPIAKPHLPQIVVDKCPVEKWIELKGLSRDAVANIVQKNITGLCLPEHPEVLKQFVDRLYTITDGNPLHLRYSLQRLKAVGKRTVATALLCDDLLPYDSEIAKYYGALWNQISGKAKEMLLTIGSVSFLFTERQLIECISHSTSAPHEITESFEQVSHLISTDASGQLGIYHNSFQLFLAGLAEMAQQNIAIKTNIKKWLEASNYEHLQWAELRLIEHELGNSTPLLKIDRNWLLNALCFPRNATQIEKQMRQAAKIAGERHEFGNALSISYLLTYYQNSKEFVDDASDLLWKQALRLNPGRFEHIQPKSIKSGCLPVVAELAESDGNYELIEAIIDILSERAQLEEYRRDTVPSSTGALLEILPFDRTIEVERIYKYVMQFRDIKISHNLFQILVRKMLLLGQRDKVAGIFRLDLNDLERIAIQTECVRFGFGKHGEDISEFLGGDAQKSKLCLLYEAISLNRYTLPALPEHRLFSNKMSEHDAVERASQANVYLENFISGVLYGLAGQKHGITEWIRSSRDTWSAKSMARLFGAGLRIGGCIGKSPVRYADLFEPMHSLDVLKWPDDRDALGFQSAFADSIKESLGVVILIKQFLNENVVMTEFDCDAATKIPAFFSSGDLENLVLKQGSRLIEDSVYTKMMAKESEQLTKTVTYFPDRAKSYCDLAKLSWIYGNNELCSSLLRKAADNILGYGYHKDVYFFEVLEAVEACAKAGTEKSKIESWTQELIPMVESIEDYTDRDETRHLRIEMGEFLAAYDRSLLCKYYFASASKEELHHAEDLFRFVIKSLPFADEEDIALASTAVEKDAFIILRALSTKLPGAKTAIASIESYLGKLSFGPEEKEQHHTSVKREPKDFAALDVDSLSEHLDSQFQSRWESEEYLRGWLAYWLGKGIDQKIYTVLKKIIEESGPQNASEEVLDMMYPLAYVFDNGAAFDLACHAQISGHGWHRYWTDKAKAQKRWRFIQERFPSRYVEFFEKSRENGVPLSRGVDYFLLFKDLKRAEEIAQASVIFGRSLMADSPVPVPDWLQQSANVEAFDMLLQRLIWPSPLVRERAATAVSDLLCDPSKGARYYDRLKTWIAGQKLETVIAIGLLPLVKALYTDVSQCDFVDVSELAQLLPVNSPVIEKLIEEIARICGVQKPALLAFPLPMQIPAGYAENPFFRKHVKGFQGPIFFRHAESIADESGEDFVARWFATADYLAKEAGVALNADQMHFFASNEHANTMSGFSSMISELYKSAFLRVLSKFHQDGGLHKDVYLMYAYKTLPIDLSEWKTLPNRAPDRWPQLKENTAIDPEPNSKIFAISYTLSPENLIERFDGKIVLGAEGAIKPANGWEEDPMHSFFLVGFAYKLHGGTLPSAEAVLRKVIYAARAFSIPSTSQRPFNFLEEPHFFLPDTAIVLDDLEAYPLVALDEHFPISLWQIFRHFAFEPFAPALGNLRPVVEKSSLEWHDDRGQKIASHSDWLEGLKERYDREATIPHGHSLSIQSDFIEAWLARRKLRLGYVLKTTHRVQQSKYDEIQSHEECRFINVGKIII